MNRALAATRTAPLGEALGDCVTSDSHKDGGKGHNSDLKNRQRFALNKCMQPKLAAIVEMSISKQVIPMSISTKDFIDICCPCAALNIMRFIENSAGALPRPPRTSSALTCIVSVTRSQHLKSLRGDALKRA
jgi:hypothetical protein